MFEELKPVFKETLKSAEEYHRLKHLLFNTHSKTSKKRLTPNDNINSSSYYESSPFYLIREREINLEKEIYTMVRKWTFPIQFREGLKN